ncbi:neurensin-1-like [Mya arenaria]|uniref:neurensin-1-like n=1 Tax=Mya arenaria TaxID=6604 RepID=UPI0022DFE776|nr:neurensin-1-like [Mya arenaria]
MAAKEDKQGLLRAEEREPLPDIAEENHDAASKPASRKTSRTSTPKKKHCPDYFGVKSYLHDFYEATYKDPSIYEDEDDFRFLLHPNPRRRRCPQIWWKIFMWLGVNLLVFGIIGILVGYLVPQKSIFLKVDEEHSEGYVDRSAMTFNTTLDVCKLIGLILFCVGGMTLAMALLFPSFLTSYCDEDPGEDNFNVRVEDEEAPLSPVDMSIPKSSKVKSVQPLRSVPEAVVTNEGVVEYHD